MTYRVEWKPSAAREFRKLPAAIQRRIRPRVDDLAENPRPAGVEKLAGAETRYRVRAGDYRVVYEIGDEVLLVLVLAVGHRRDVYR